MSNLSSYFHKAALTYLQQRICTISHLKLILERRLFRLDMKRKTVKRANSVQIKEAIETALEPFIKSGVLNDEKYANLLCEKFRRVGKSGKWIEGEMKRKLVPSEFIEKAMSDVDGNKQDPDVLAALIFAKKRKLGPFDIEKGCNDYGSESVDEKNARRKLEQRILAKFARGGFSFDITNKILKMSLQEATNYIANNTGQKTLGDL